MFALQATVKEPAILNMRKGISMAYTMISSTYFTVAISGYWAFGQTVLPYLLNNLTTPTWPITIANIAAIIQITGCYQVSFHSAIHFRLAINMMCLCFINKIASRAASLDRGSRYDA